MKRRECNTVIWDLDGTLVDSVADIAQAVNLVLAEYDLASLPPAEIRVMVGNGAGKLLDRAFAAVDGLNSYCSSEAYQSFICHYKKRSCEQTQLFVGIDSVLNDLSEAGISQGVCTNKPYEITVDILRKLNVAQYFGSVVGGDSTEHRKPHALPLRTCMKHLQAEQQSTLLIGDSAADVGAARNTGIKVAVLPWGYGPASVAELDADFVLSDAAAIRRLLLM